MLPVAVRSSEPLDIVATRNLPIETIYVCRLRGRGKLSVSANRPTPSRILLLSTATVAQGKGIVTNKKRAKESAPPMESAFFYCLETPLALTKPLR